MDVRFINPFVQSVRRVFETMVHCRLNVGKPYLKRDDFQADVSGIIGFSGDAAGCVVISFVNDVACKVASAFAGIAITEDHPDFADAIGELANMVAGNAKKEFTDLNIRISLPSVVIGENFVVTNSRSAPRIIIPCDCELGKVYVEVGMEIVAAETTTAGAVSAARGA